MWQVALLGEGRRGSSQLEEKQRLLDDMREVHVWKAKQDMLQKCFAWGTVYATEDAVEASYIRFRITGRK
jgi:hypothetical protein